MRKILFLFSIILLIGCRQNQEVSNNEEKPTPQPKEFTETVENIEFKMIRIEAVKKTILGKGIPENERPVTLSPYYIAETEVTQELYKAITGKSPSYFNGSAGKEAPEGEVQEKRPVEWVNWYEATMFCNKLTEKIKGSADECVYEFKNIKENNGTIEEAEVTYDFSKKGFRLPTEAEWEYAGKGGDIDVVYAGGTLKLGEQEDKEHTVLKTLAWYNGNSGKVTHQVKMKEPNAYGLYDMSGNVREWCNDWYASPVLQNVERDPQGPTRSTAYRTTKGGGHDFGGYLACVLSNRNGTLPKQHENDRGFRIVCRR